MLLFRPVGIRELALIYASKMTAFPPRLPDQPIFYPVLNEAYATQIASDWNTRAAPFAGYVTRFDVDDAYASRFERRKGCPAEPEAQPQLHALAHAQQAGDAELARELKAAELCTFLYFPYWACPGVELGLAPASLAATLESIQRCWPRVMAAAPLLAHAARTHLGARA